MVFWVLQPANNQLKSVIKYSCDTTPYVWHDKEVCIFTLVKMHARFSILSCVSGVVSQQSEPLRFSGAWLRLCTFFNWRKKIWKKYLHYFLLLLCYWQWLLVVRTRRALPQAKVREQPPAPMTPQRAIRIAHRAQLRAPRAERLQRPPSRLRLHRLLPPQPLAAIAGTPLPALLLRPAPNAVQLKAAQLDTAGRMQLVPPPRLAASAVQRKVVPLVIAGRMLHILTQKHAVFAKQQRALRWQEKSEK